MNGGGIPGAKSVAPDSPLDGLFPAGLGRAEGEENRSETLEARKKATRKTKCTAWTPRPV